MCIPLIAQIHVLLGTSPVCPSGLQQSGGLDRKATLAIGLGAYWPSVMIPCMSSTLSRVLMAKPGK